METVLDQYPRVRKSLEGVATTLPFMAFFGNIAPSYPSSVSVGTGMAVGALVLWIITFVFVSPHGQAFAKKSLRISIVMLALFAIAYCVLFTYYTMPIPVGERAIKGYAYTPMARKYLQARPTDTDFELLESAEFDTERVWTHSSIMRVKLTLVGLWSGAFIWYAMTVFLFEVWFAKREGTRRVREANRARSQSDSDDLRQQVPSEEHDADAPSGQE